MANIEYRIKNIFEELFNMKTGYVLDFSNRTFRTFIGNSIGIDIYNDPGYEDEISKANKFRQIISNEPDNLVIKLLNDLIEYYEDYKLKRNALDEYDKKKIEQVRNYISSFNNDNGNIVELHDDLKNKVQYISTRNGEFSKMPINEKLEMLNNLIESLLKHDNKYVNYNYEEIAFDFIKNEDIKKFREKTQCFRHGSDECIRIRNQYTEGQKEFLVEYGIFIANLIFKFYNKK